MALLHPTQHRSNLPQIACDSLDAAHVKLVLRQVHNCNLSNNVNIHTAPSGPIEQPLLRLELPKNIPVPSVS
jgi:hypothetical protein